jgi:hypothetical protein
MQCYNWQTFGHVLGKLQATSTLLLVYEQPPAQGLSRGRKPFFNTDMLQLPAGRSRDSTSLQLSGLREYEGRDVKKEIQVNTQDYNWKDCLKIYHPNYVLCSGASRQLRAKSDHIYTGMQWRSDRPRDFVKQTATGKR